MFTFFPHETKQKRLSFGFVFVHGGIDDARNCCRDLTFQQANYNETQNLPEAKQYKTKQKKRGEVVTVVMMVPYGDLTFACDSEQSTNRQLEINTRLVTAFVCRLT
jgi:hypothetical protein